MTLELEPQELYDIITLIGRLPTESNAYPLWSKMKVQYEAQLPKEDPKDEIS